MATSSSYVQNINRYVSLCWVFDGWIFAWNVFTFVDINFTWLATACVNHSTQLQIMRLFLLFHILQIFQLSRKPIRYLCLGVRVHRYVGCLEIRDKMLAERCAFGHVLSARAAFDAHAHTFTNGECNNNWSTLCLHVSVCVVCAMYTFYIYVHAARSECVTSSGIKSEKMLSILCATPSIPAVTDWLGTFEH